MNYPEDSQPFEAMAPDSNKTRKPSLLKRFARPVFWLFSLLFTGLVIGSVVVFGVFYYYSKDLPDSSSLANYNPPGMTRFYSKNGEVIAEYAKQRRIYVPFEDIPKRVTQAFIAAEDKSFYEHRGIDPMGILRALVENARKIGNNERSLVGGSTITQQVVKNFLLTNEKSLERKIKEAILALRITQTYSKDRILELYLNEIYLGMGAYGVAAASIEYFNKELHELDTEEIALLAAMPKAPGYFGKHLDEAKRRRNYVIRRMFEDGYINEAEHERAVASEMIISDKRLISEPKAPFFSEEVRRFIVQKYDSDMLYNKSLFVKTTVDLEAQAMLDNALRKALISYDRRHGYRGALDHLDDLDQWRDALRDVRDNTPLFGDQDVAVVLEMDDSQAILGFLRDEEEGGNPEELLVDETTKAILPFSAMRWARPVRPSGSLKAAPKKPADVLLKGDVVLVSPLSNGSGYALEQIPEVSGAMVAMRPSSGEVLAMSGGYSFGKSQFNRATQAKRQPGSSFKPFVYMAALERGFSPSSIIVDAPIEISQGPGKPMWRPKNYGGRFYGPSTLRTGLEKSRNVMTVKLAQRVGLPVIKAIGERFGIYDDVSLDYSMVLGAHEATVMNMVTAYSMVVNGGLRVTPTLVRRIDNRDGKTIYRAETRTCSRCNQKTSDALKVSSPPRLKDTRERVADPRVAYQMITLLEGVVQRGTATKAKALGFEVAGKTGTTNDSRDAWFVGFTQDLVVGVYIGFDTPRSLGRKETGGGVALPAFMDFMKTHYTQHMPPTFNKPSGVLEVRVDRNTGVPPLPWQQSGATITETFVTGGSIFVPGAEIELSAPDVPKQEEFVDYDYQRDIYSPNVDNATGGVPSSSSYDYDDPTLGSIQPRSNNPYSTQNSLEGQRERNTQYNSIEPQQPPQQWDVPPWQRAQQPVRPVQQKRRVNDGVSLPIGHPSRKLQQRRRRSNTGTGGLY